MPRKTNQRLKRYPRTVQNINGIICIMQTLCKEHVKSFDNNDSFYCGAIENSVGVARLK